MYKKENNNNEPFGIGQYCELCGNIYISNNDSPCPICCKKIKTKKKKASDKSDSGADVLSLS